MSSSLYTRIFVAVFCVTALSVFLAAYLNYAKFEGAYSRVEADRYRFAATDIVASLENELDLGISIERMTSAERVLSEAFARSRGMSGAIVFDAEGKVLFSAGLPPVRDSVPAGWLSSMRTGEAGAFSGMAEETKVVGNQLVNNFGRVVGGVAVGYSAQDGALVTNRVGMHLIVGALVVAAIAMVVCSIGLRWLTSSISSRVRTMAAALGGGGSVDKDEIEELEEEAQRVAAADAEAAEALRELAEAEKHLGRLSEKVG